MIHHGDCLDVMATFEPSSVDAIVTDPPYNLVSGNARYDLALTGAGNPRERRPKGPNGGFMGKAWDGTGIAFDAATWEAALRVAKPSSYLLAFGGTRTVHRMTCAIEDAGWIIRDMLVWGYASGFPKSKASLKPAWEPIVMARKPGPLRMLNIDECRIAMTDDDRAAVAASMSGQRNFRKANPSGPAAMALVSQDYVVPPARWPANIILTDPIFDGGIDGVVGGGTVDATRSVRSHAGTVIRNGITGNPYIGRRDNLGGYDDSGTYSRFFLVPKAARTDREPVLGGLPQGFGPVIAQARRGRCVECGHWKERAAPNICPCGGAYEYESNAPTVRQNVHPTVKPVELMRHLVRLVTPAGGTVLDPFLGSGTTGLAAEMEGFAWIGIEKEAEYVAIAEARLNGTQKGMAL